MHLQLSGEFTFVTMKLQQKSITETTQTMEMQSDPKTFGWDHFFWLFF